VTWISFVAGVVRIVCPRSARHVAAWNNASLRIARRRWGCHPVKRNAEKGNEDHHDHPKDFVESIEIGSSENAVKNTEPDESPENKQPPKETIGTAIEELDFHKVCECAASA